MNNALRERLLDLLNAYAADLRVRLAAATDAGMLTYHASTRLLLAEVEATITDLHKMGESR